MNKTERDGLVERMGQEIGILCQALDEGASGIAREAFVRFMAGAGLLAIEIDQRSPQARVN